MEASLVRRNKGRFNGRIMSCMRKKTCPSEGDFTGRLSIFITRGDE